MSENKENLLRDVANYYSDKLAVFGDTPRGVDWNSQNSQIIRFDQLCKVIDFKLSSFSLTDLGCGYGALCDYLSSISSQCSYLGVDVSEDMIKAAHARQKASPTSRFITASEPDVISDYGVASGIFNVRLDRTDKEWFDYVTSSLEVLNRSSRLGFSFNCLTSYSDSDKKKDYLYYADPCDLFDLCKRRYSHQIALLHDYGLYEFTIIVRKS